jgi:urease accessory protein
VSDTRITVAPSATLLYAEIVQPGRKHHHSGECVGAAVISMARACRHRFCGDEGMVRAENL